MKGEIIMGYTGNSELNEYIRIYEELYRSILIGKAFLTWQDEHGSFELSDEDIVEVALQVDREMEEKQMEIHTSALCAWASSRYQEEHEDEDYDFEEEEEYLSDEE
ncbi:MAG: hypothetical protein LUD41_01900 [Phascolarctobacterium sp.]|nr:hypothetical protein [Phascolarctobacterium sp.]